MIRTLTRRFKVSGVRVTIGLPFFNNERTLVQAIQSVYAQTYADWELILIDDGSTDASVTLVRQIDDPRVTIVADGLNKGLAYRLNQITSLASGEYVARMDADDLMHPRRIQRQVEFLKSHPNVDVVGTALYSIDAENGVSGVRSIAHRHDNPADAIKRGWILHPTIMGRREWFLRHPYDGSLRRSEDLELWCRAARGSRFAHIDEALYFYREQGTFDLGKYLQSCAADRQVFWRHGPALVGYPHTTWLVAKSFLKSWCYGLAAAFGAESILIRRRNRKVSEEERRETVKIIDTVLATHVPGLSVGSWNGS